jgi:hypothetical protein
MVGIVRDKPDRSRHQKIEDCSIIIARRLEARDMGFADKTRWRMILAANWRSASSFGSAIARPSRTAAIASSSTFAMRDRWV